jgi:phosphodiesterase/alkaline phosphatase D-like protein
MKKLLLASFVSLFLLVGGSWAQQMKNGKHEAEKITNGPDVKETTKDSAKITWSTDNPGSTIVKYGTNPNALDHKAEEPWGGKRESNGDYEHTVWVKGLKPNTTYYFKVETGQGLGTGTEADSKTGEFKTK